MHHGYMMLQNDPIAKFASEQMGDKTLLDVPGVGPELLKLLIKNHVEKPSDLYLVLKKLKFDEKAFERWMHKDISKRAKVPTIYKALMAWHEKFGHSSQDFQSLSNGSETSGTESPPPRQSLPAASHGRIRRASIPSPTERAKSPVRFDESQQTLIDTSKTIVQKYSVYVTCDERILDNATSRSVHPLIQYLASFSTVFKNIPENHHGEFRRDVLDLAEKFEKLFITNEKEMEPQLSTSTAS